MTLTSTLSIADACKRIVTAPAPVVLLDTCAVLDLIRAPTQKGTRHLLAGASALRTRAADSPPAVWTVVTTAVMSEWRDNIDGSVQALDQHIAEVDNKCALLDEAHLHLNPQAVARPSYSSYALTAALRSEAQALLDQSLVLAQDDMLALKGYARHTANRPPSEKGRNEVDDCIVIEHYLALVKALRDDHYTEPCLYISSNRKDYCAGGSTLHPELQQEFDPLQLDFGLNLAFVLKYVR